MVNPVKITHNVRKMEIFIHTDHKIQFTLCIYGDFKCVDVFTSISYMYVFYILYVCVVYDVDRYVFFKP